MKINYHRLLRSALAGGLVPGALMVAAVAQTPRWRTPTLGFVYDSGSKSIRPLSGVVGSASLEGGLAVPVKLESASLSPNRQIALAQTVDGDHLLVVRWSNGAGTADSLDAAPAKADMIAWSPDGSSAVIYNAEASLVQVWKSLDASPTLLQQANLSDLRSLAVADDGFAVAGTDNTLMLIADEPKTLANTPYSALAFVPGSHDLAAGDSVLNQVVLIHNLGPDAKISVLASAQDGVGQPTALSFSQDGTKLAVANSQAKSVLLVNRSAATVQAFSCDCAPEGLYPTQGNAVFRFTSTKQDQIRILDGDATQPRLLSIPVGGRQ